MSSITTALLPNLEQDNYGEYGPVYGNRFPRISTDPLRPLVDGSAGVRTTDGYRVIKFARDVLKKPLLPYQEEIVIRALELLPNGRYRFKTVLVIVARQNGKTFLSQVLALFKMLVQNADLILGTAQNLRIAREVWAGAVKMLQSDPRLACFIKSIRKTNGEQELELVNGSRYIIAATNDDAGRGFTVDHLTLDEIRQHKNFDAYAALQPTTRKPPMAQIWAISNAGDAESVVLNDLRDKAIAGADSIGIFEWSAPKDFALDAEAGWLAANPGIGYLFPVDDMQAALDGSTPDKFRTEYLCQTVENLNGAINADAWKAIADSNGTMEGLRERLALLVDVSRDNNHASLAVAAETDSGTVHVELVEVWVTDAAGSAADHARRDIGGWIEKIQPKALGYFVGPAGAIAAELDGLGAIALNNAKAAEACQGFADLVQSRGLVHHDQGALTAHVIGAKKYYSGDTWRFIRQGPGHVDAAYAAAGAVYLTRTTEEPEECTWLPFTL